MRLTSACPVLTLSERLDDLTLVEMAGSKSQDHLFAISRRQSLSQVVTDVLVECGDAQVLLSVAGNAGALFSQRGYECLGWAGRRERQSRRADRPKEGYPAQGLRRMLLRTASEQVHARLAAELPHAAHEIRHSRAERGHAYRRSATQSETRDIDAVRALVEKLHREGQLDDERIRNFAEDGRLEEVRIALSLVSDLPAPFIDQALSQESGEMLLVIAGANGFAWATVDLIPQSPDLAAARNGRRDQTLPCAIRKAWSYRGIGHRAVPQNAAFALGSA